MIRSSEENVPVPLSALAEDTQQVRRSLGWRGAPWVGVSVSRAGGCAWFSCTVPRVASFMLLITAKLSCNMSDLLLVCFNGFTFSHSQKQHRVSRGVGKYLFGVASVHCLWNVLSNTCDTGVALGLEAQVLQLFTQCVASLTQVQLFHGDQGLPTVMGSQPAVLRSLINSDCTASTVIWGAFGICAGFGNQLFSRDRLLGRWTMRLPSIKPSYTWVFRMIKRKRKRNLILERRKIRDGF